MELFKDGHYLASAMYVYKDELHLSTTNDQELLELLADRARNPDYDYIAKLFQKYHEAELGGHNGSSIFQHLVEVVNDFNNSGCGRAIFQEYNADVGNSFILCIVTDFICRVHEKVRQAGELCYVNASSSFEHLNNSITLLFTSCTIGALPLGLIITSDEFEVTLEKAINMLKSILPPYAFFGRDPQVSPEVFLTNDSSAKCNALELCWPRGKLLFASILLSLYE